MNDNVAMTVYDASGSARTVHLFNGAQPYATEPDDTYRTLCGITIASERVRNPHGEPICVRCINAENTKGN